MFGGKHGSLRKVLYKRNKSDSTSSSATSTSPNAAETGGVSPRPASQSFNFPLKPPPGGNPSTIVPPLLNSPSMQLDDSQFPQPPSSPTASGIPSASRLRVRNAGFDFNNPQVVYNSATCSAANTPMVDTDSPLTVDCTNCVCNINLPLSSNSSPGGGSANRANPPKSHRLFAPQFSGPASTNGGQDGLFANASPQYYYNTAAAGANGGRSMPAALNVPLLIPLGPGGVVRRGERGAGRALHHRSSISGGMGYGQRASPGAGNNLYLATRLDHPTVFDFEDWHTSLDKRE
uniref:CBS domain-containing protein n=1 Tax=Ditylenchus dipsaci TaxID=166011 RepID=A0A915DPX7_9BILA